MNQERVLRGSSGDTEGPPAYDGEAVKVLASRAQLRSIELTEVTFQDLDSQEPFDTRVLGRDIEPEVGLFIEWQLDTERSRLSCLVTASYSLQLPTHAAEDQDEASEAEQPVDEPEEAWLQAVYRVVYEVAEVGSPITKEQGQQFAHWNVPFNVWPYFRELTSNVLQRTRHTPLLVPLFRMPR